jgi:hypothetical protein
VWAVLVNDLLKELACCSTRVHVQGDKLPHTLDQNVVVVGLRGEVP